MFTDVMAEFELDVIDRNITSEVTLRTFNSCCCQGIEHHLKLQSALDFEFAS